MDLEHLKQRWWRTKDATIARRECTRKAMEVSTKNEAEGNCSSVDEEVSRNQESKGTEGSTSVGDDHNSGMARESLSCVNTLKKLGTSRVPKAPPQKRRAVIRVESAETQDYVPEPQEMEEFSFFPSAVNEPRWAVHMCNNKCNKEGNKFYQLAAIGAKGGAAHTINPCKQCWNAMRMKRGERKVTASPSKKNVALDSLGRCEEREARRERRSLSSTAGTCALKVGKAIWENFEKDDKLSVLGKGTSEGMLQRSRNRRRRPFTHCAGHSA